jgi:hypothetical protein
MASKPLVYATLCYYILKQMAGVELAEPNIALTVVAVVVVSLNLTVSYFEPLYRLETEHLFYAEMRSKNVVAKLTFFPLMYWEKLKFIISLRSVLLTVGLSTLLISYLVCHWFKLNLLVVVQLWYLALIPLTFIMMEWLVQVCNFVPELFRVELKHLKDKMPIMLTLLRLP